MALLAVSGALIGNSRWGSPWASWTEPPAVNVALVGRPSSGKSSAIDALQSILGTIEEDMNTDWDERCRACEGEKIAAKQRRANHERDVKNALDKRVPPPDLPAAAIDPATPERRRC